MSRLISPFASVKLGDNIWHWGDGRLKAVSVTSAEGHQGNTCTFSLYDKNRTVTNALLEFVQEVGGLEPLELPEGPKTTGPSSGVAVGTASQNMTAMLATISKYEGTSGPNGYRTLVGGGTFSSFADHPRQLIYIESIGDSSDAAGKYQYLSTTWDSLGLPDFTPENQDKGAIALINRRGVTAAVEAGDIRAALVELSFEWASLPYGNDQYRYEGQGTATVADVLAYFSEQIKAISPEAQSRAAVAESNEEAAAPPKEAPTRTKALAGSQITVGLGFNGEVFEEWSFLNTSLNYSMYDHDVLEIGGVAATWVMTQRVKNSAYTNVTFKQLAQKLCSAYGLKLDMPIDGPKYEYFPQRGVSDYQALLIEARRIGLRMTTMGGTLTIKPRGEQNFFTLVRGGNLGKEFTLSHSAQGSGGGGARSSDPSQKTTTGQRKVEIDPDTGQMKKVKAEVLTGAGDTPEKFTTGSAVAIAAPRTDGKTDAEDSARQSNEARVKGIEASWSAPTTPELLSVTVDDAIATEGISSQMDRIWVAENITHSLGSDGFKTSGKLYSPMRNKYPTLQGSGLSLVRGEGAGSNAEGLIKPIGGAVLTSGFKTANRPTHKGVDLAAPVGTPIWAAADGILTIEAPDPTGYGSWVSIQHNTLNTRYGHLSAIKATNGATVKQGDVIALCGGQRGAPGAGSSSGPHLHWEVLRGDIQENPAIHVNL